MNILITGMPGSGKGTMSERIRSEFDVVHVSSGDLFRDNVANDTPVGHIAKIYMDAGQLVPDEVTIEMVHERIKEIDDQTGILLDGFPRTIVQAIVFEEQEEELNRELDVVLNLIIDENLLLKRITGRRICPTCGAIYNVYNQPPKVEGICDVEGSKLYQRSDDTEEAFNVRMEQYRALTQPMLDYYQKRGILKEVEARGSIDDVWNQIKLILEDLNGSH